MRSGHLSVAVAVLLASTVVWGQKIKTRDVPAWAPRAVWAGLLINDQAVSPQLRLQWEGMIANQFRDALMLVGEIGGGYAVGLPKNAGPDANETMTFLYQHSIVGGVGYRGWRGQNFRWGLQILFGPHFYGARFENLPTENRINGIVEGRAQFGWDVGPVSLGVSAGYASPFSKPILSNAAPHVGGWMLGAYVDWWH